MLLCRQNGGSYANLQVSVGLWFIHSSKKMTLVVARRREDEITIVSDTRITHDSQQSVEHIRGAVVKCVILSLTISVSFSGHVPTAAKVIHEFFEKWLNLPREEIINNIFQCHNDSNQAADFIVAFLQPSMLVCIKGGQVLRDVDTAWIGDWKAFFAFQKFANEAEVINVDRSGDEYLIMGLRVADQLARNKGSVISTLFKSMKAVIDARVSNMVGGFSILLVTDNQHFRYGEYVDSESSKLEIDEFDLPIAYPIGSEACGHYTVYYAFAQYGSRCVPVLYFPEGKLGVIFELTQAGGMKSLGLPAWSFDEFLCKIRTNGLTVRATLPNEDQLRLMATNLHSNLSLKQDEDTAECLSSKSSQSVSTKPRPQVRVLNCKVAICEVLSSTEDLAGYANVLAKKPKIDVQDITGYVDALVKQPGALLFIHKVTGRKISLGEVFSKTIFQQRLVSGFKVGELKTLFSYLLCNESDEDHFSVRINGREIAIHRLVISGTVIADM